MTTIKIPSQRVGRSKIRYMGDNWYNSQADNINNLIRKPTKEICFDLSNIEFISLFEWLTFLSVVSKLVRNDMIDSIGLDLFGSMPNRMLPMKEYFKGRTKPRRGDEEDYNQTERVVKILNFIDGLGTKTLLHGLSNARIYYPGLLENIEFENKSYYVDSENRRKSILPIKRILSKEDCASFLSADEISKWRSYMDEVYLNSPVFINDEIWRVFCHELAVNAWEHGDEVGFISIRSIKTGLDRPENKSWFKYSFPKILLNKISKMRGGFLELCMADAGNGFINTLGSAYNKIMDTNWREEASGVTNLLAFAFDKLGTCKNINEGWATERHALGRILDIVERYNGILRLRSGGGEIIYSTDGGVKAKMPSGFGYQPKYKKIFKSFLPGSQLQIIVPLYPKYRKNKSERTDSVLYSYMPKSFEAEKEHARGHLIPIVEHVDMASTCTGSAEQKQFRKSCEIVIKNLLATRPSNEPFVFDMSRINWSAGQLETFLYYAQSVIQGRPALLVELDKTIIKELQYLEETCGGTELNNNIPNWPKSITGKSFNKPSETLFMETYSGIKSPVMALDRDGAKYIIGIQPQQYEKILLSLIEDPKSTEEILNSTYFKFSIDKSVLRSILYNSTNLVRKDDKGQWKTVWDARQLSIEAKRVIIYHFDKLVERCCAWHAKAENDDGINAYNLPWQKEWRGDFLESSKILSRERYQDEIAQRLIYRLTKGLSGVSKSIEDISILAGMTSPSIMLAAALRKWWPTANKPVVSDLSYYTLFSEQIVLPRLEPIHKEGVVIVQDVLDEGNVSQKVIDLLKENSIEVSAIVGFVGLNKTVNEVRTTSIDEGWNANGGEIPRHFIIEAPKPENIDINEKKIKDDQSYWIEPRSLRPVRYTTLRREFATGRDEDLDRREEALKILDGEAGDCFISAGHYVYGSRHYFAAVDIHKIIQSSIGNKLADWIAEVCIGEKRDRLRPWESNVGKTLKGETSFVLMPLHSQIHYLWPKVMVKLGAIGKRIPMWLLDATLFGGKGPTYMLPDQLIVQLKYSIEKAVKKVKINNSDKIRIMIIDDTIASGRTAETILGTIFWHIEKILKKDYKKKLSEVEIPIEWIRYFTIINQLEHVQHVLWRKIGSIGKNDIKFVMEDFAPFMGIPVYTEENCPTCHSILRLNKLKDNCKEIGSNPVKKWIENTIDKMKPIAIDSPGFKEKRKIPIPNGIDVLANKPPEDGYDRYVPKYADSAIWRFYSYMHYSYPPSDVIESIIITFDRQINCIQEKEHERYRLAVYDWCLKNWNAVKATTSEDMLLRAIELERDYGSDILPNIMEQMSKYYFEDKCVEFIEESLNRLLTLEKTVHKMSLDGMDKNEKILKNLFTGLSLFYLSIPSIDDLSNDENKPISFRRYQAVGKLNECLDYCGNQSIIDKCSLLRILYLQISKPKRHANPSWALKCLAETIFRGRDINSKKDDSHSLLPRLISDWVRGGETIVKRHFLIHSINSFLSGLDEITHYVIPAMPDDLEKVKDKCRDLLKWISGDDWEKIDPPEALYELNDMLNLESSFMKTMSHSFHCGLNYLQQCLDDECDRVRTDEKNIECKIKYSQEDMQYCVLTSVPLLVNSISNIAIKPIERQNCEELKSEIIVFGEKGALGIEYLKFRVLTQFSDHMVANERMAQGKSINIERYNLTNFGVKFDDQFKPVSSEEKKMGFEAAYEIRVPTGYKSMGE